jgi:hypothetical protein
MGETAKFTSHMSWTTTAFLWGKLTFSCNEYTCLMSAKHQSSTQYQDWYILYIVMGEITKFTSHVSWVTLCEKNHIIVVISDIETGKKLLLLWVLTLCLYWYKVCYCLRSYQPGSVLNTNLNTTCKSTYQTNTGHNMQHADWLRNHCDPQCSVPYLQMQGSFWSYFKYQSVCVIPFSNHDWKQTTSLYHAIYITACEGICSCLSVFRFATCITSPCTLVAKRVEVVPCYTCYYYYYYYVNAFFSSPCFFCILCVMTTERSF